MNLILIRHAVAMDRLDFQRLSQTELDDDLRPLTEDGARKMRKNAKGLRRLLAPPTLFLTSPLLRARQTAEIIQNVAWPELMPHVCEALRPDARPTDFGLWLQANASGAVNLDDEKNKASFAELGGKATIALVGHEPHLSRLLGWFISGAKKNSGLSIKKGGAAWISFPTPDILTENLTLTQFLPTVFEQKSGQLEWLVTPRLLRALRA